MIDETEQKILEAALEEFINKGYSGSTTACIADKSGFSEKTLFRKFESKQNLFDQVFIYSITKSNEDAYSQLFVDKEFKYSPGLFRMSCFSIKIKLNVNGEVEKR